MENHTYSREPETVCYIHQNNDVEVDWHITRRFKTPTGWIVESERILLSHESGRTNSSIASCFVPDPNHEWILEEMRGG